jgi:NADPH2:quinone reductase
MKAAFYERKGPAREVLQVGERPTPEPAAGEVRVRVHVSAVNPSDTKVRSGARGRTAMPFPLMIPNQDGAGVIDAVGSGVDAARIGERVWVYEAHLNLPFGTAAQWCTVPSHKAVRQPANAGFDAGACMGIPAMTAHRCVFADGSVRGQTVLVQGGAGAVGYYAIQLAKLDGARVFATVSRAEQAERARDAGADALIDYKREDVATRVRELAGAAEPLDRVVEVAFGANLATDVALLKAGGVIATYASDAAPEPPWSKPPRC